MIQLGNFFFKHRNLIFIFLYLLLFLPSPPLCGSGGDQWETAYIYPIIFGLLITIFGQIIRGCTIGLIYIIRGGYNKKVYADELVTTGIFSHVRNPLYVGNILMLWGVGLLANSLIFVLIVMPLFLFIYQSIVLAEESYLAKKFGESFIRYTQRVNRWFPQTKGIKATFSFMKFNWKRWLIKEYGTQFIWLLGIICIFPYKYPGLFGVNPEVKYTYLAISIPVVTFYYLTIRYLKKTGIWSDS